MVCREKSQERGRILSDKGVWVSNSEVINMEYSKLQIGCLLIVLYIAAVYFWEKKEYKVKKKEPVFFWVLVVGMASILFDAVTAYTVNHLDSIPSLLNDLLHLCFLCSLDAIVFLMFLYILDITGRMPKKKSGRLLLMLPLLFNLCVVICFIPELTYRKGSITNYSMGISAYTCFVMVAIYMLATILLLASSWKNLGRHKMVTISTYLAVSLVAAGYQMVHPQSLISCLVPTMAIIGSYLNMENPLFVKLRGYNQEMVMGFSTLVENRDGSTGGHIKRSTAYVELLAKELQNRGFYKEQLSKEYIKNLVSASPMHDVGKIAIPDAILQKPGRLTSEEFAIMKTHAERGGVIIRETFGQLGDDEYEKMAYEVARYHHEKWNGKGYPEGLSRKEIPLCARIMAVADVFDAVSAKRCYRDALPLEECFSIIEQGSGQDFDPVIAEVFLDMREEIQRIMAK